MPNFNSVFKRKSSTTSRSKICQEEYQQLTLAFKSIVRRLIICYKSLCCFPFDQIIPGKPRSPLNRISGLCQTSQRGLTPVKILHILPRSRVSFSEPLRTKSQICPRKSINNEIPTPKKVKSEYSILKNAKSNLFSEIKLNIKEEKPTKKTKAKIIKEKSKKILDFGSGSIKQTFRHRNKSSGSCRSIDTSVKIKIKSKHDISRENRWKRTKRMMKMSNASNLKWIRHAHDTKRRESLTATSTGNEESAGDGLVTPKLSSNNNKIPLQWTLVKEQVLVIANKI